MHDSSASRLNHSTQKGKLALMQHFEPVSEALLCFLTLLFMQVSEESIKTRVGGGGDAKFHQTNVVMCCFYRCGMNRTVCVCVCVCMGLYVLHIEYQHTHSASKVRTCLQSEDIVDGPHNFKGLRV